MRAFRRKYSATLSGRQALCCVGFSLIASFIIFSWADIAAELFEIPASSQPTGIVEPAGPTANGSNSDQQRADGKNPFEQLAPALLTSDPRSAAKVGERLSDVQRPASAPVPVSPLPDEVTQSDKRQLPGIHDERQFLALPQANPAAQQARAPTGNTPGQKREALADGKPVTLRAGLIAENPQEPSFPKIAPGQVIWSMAAPEASEKTRVLSGEVSIPELGVNVTLQLLLPGGDTPTAAIVIIFAQAKKPQLAASATVESVEVRRTSAERGIPLRGRLESRKPGEWLLNLSEVSSDYDGNMQAIASHEWIDVNLVLSDRSKRILTIERGRVADGILASPGR